MDQESLKQEINFSTIQIAYKPLLPRSCGSHMTSIGQAYFIFHIWPSLSDRSWCSQTPRCLSAATSSSSQLYSSSSSSNSRPSRLVCVALPVRATAIYTACCCSSATRSARYSSWAAAAANLRDLCAWHYLVTECARLERILATQTVN